MILPSVAFEKAIDDAGVTRNTIIARNQKWFDELYISRYQSPLEPNITPFLEVGKAYSFTYDAKYKDKLSFWDALPHLMIVLGHIEKKDGTKNVLGINFSFIPPKIRMAVLDKIVNIFSSNVIDPNRENIDKGKFHSLTKMPLHYEVAKNILKGSGFEFAIRSYIYTRIRTEPRVITFNDWWRVATFPSKFIEKLNIRAIYYLYKKNIESSYRIGQRDKLPEIEEIPKEDLQKILKRRG